MARSVPTTVAVVASSCARSLRRSSSLGATVPPPRSFSVTRGPSTRIVAGPICRCARWPRASVSTAAQQPTQILVADLLCRERRQRASRFPQHEQRVLRGRHPRGDDLGGRHAGVLREQREQRLALGGVATGEGARHASIAVDRGAPEPLEQLVVVRVAPVDPDRERRAVGVQRLDRVDAGDLALGRMQVVRLDAELAERGRDGLERRPSCRRSEREADGGAGGDADQDGRRRTPDRRPPLHDRREAPEREQVAPGLADRARELPVHHRDDRGRHREPDRGELEVVRQSRRVRRVGPAAVREPGCDQPERDGERDGQHRLERDPGATRDQRDDEHDGGPQGEQPDQESPDGIEPARQRLEEHQDRALERPRRLREDHADEREQRRAEQDDVGGAPDAVLVGRCRVELTRRLQRVRASPSAWCSGPRPRGTPVRRVRSSAAGPAGIRGAAERVLCPHRSSLHGAVTAIRPPHVESYHRAPLRLDLRSGSTLPNVKLIAVAAAIAVTGAPAAHARAAAGPGDPLPEPRGHRARRAGGGCPRGGSRRDDDAVHGRPIDAARHRASACFPMGRPGCASSFRRARTA